MLYNIFLCYITNFYVVCANMSQCEQNNGIAHTDSWGGILSFSFLYIIFLLLPLLYLYSVIFEEVLSLFDVFSHHDVILHEGNHFPVSFHHFLYLWRRL